MAVFSEEHAQRYMPLFEFLDKFRIEHTGHLPLTEAETMTLIRGWTVIADVDTCDEFFQAVYAIACNFSTSPSRWPIDGKSLAVKVNAFIDAGDSEQSYDSYDDESDDESDDASVTLKSELY